MTSEDFAGRCCPCSRAISALGAVERELISSLLTKLLTPRDRDPDYARVRATLGWAYFLSGGGRRSEAIAELERAVALSPLDTVVAGAAARAGVLHGHPRFEALLGQLKLGG